MGLAHQIQAVTKPVTPVTKVVTPVPEGVTKAVTFKPNVTKAVTVVADVGYFDIFTDMEKRLAALEATVAELTAARKRDDPAAYMREYRKRKKFL